MPNAEPALRLSKVSTAMIRRTGIFLSGEKELIAARHRSPGASSDVSAFIMTINCCNCRKMSSQSEQPDTWAIAADSSAPVTWFSAMSASISKGMCDEAFMAESLGGPGLTERTDHQKIHRIHLCQDAQQLAETTRPGRANTAFRNSQHFRRFRVRWGFPLIKEESHQRLAALVQLRHRHADPVLLFEDQQLLVRQWQLVSHRLSRTCAVVAGVMRAQSLGHPGHRSQGAATRSRNQPRMQTLGVFYIVEFFKERGEYVLKDLGRLILTESRTAGNRVDESLVAA